MFNSLFCMTKVNPYSVEKVVKQIFKEQLKYESDIPVIVEMLYNHDRGKITIKTPPVTIPLNYLFEFESKLIKAFGLSKCITNLSIEKYRLVLTIAFQFA